MRPPALLFDLDGTLVDTDPLHLAAIREVFAPFGVTVDHDTYATRIMGRANADIGADFLPGESVATRAATLDRKEALFRAALSGAEPRPGVRALLDWADRAGAPTAVVTNAPRANAEAILAAIGLTGRFGTLVIGDELPRAKPDPLPYLTAMERLGVGPADALAFEDSPSGLRAAAASGAHVFALRGVLPDAALADADEIVDDFAAPALWRRLGAPAP
jgi:HAD superfamily hydrolase (TIGR01509 family)